jgi:hypothetical protein
VAKIFVGSSSQSLPLVREIGAWLQEAGHEVYPWDSYCKPGAFILDELQAAARHVDAAVLIFAEDDRISDPETKHVTRDNVLIEFGLFVATLGTRRAIICRDEAPNHPSDLAGLVYIDVSAKHRMRGRRELEGWVSRLAASEPKRADQETVGVRSCFPTELFKRLLIDATQIRILQTFIPHAAHLASFDGELLRAITAKSQVEVLLCDPWSPVCQIRQSALDPEGAVDVKAEIERNLFHFQALRRKLPEAAKSRLTVRVYSTLPSMSIYQVDDTFICGNYFHGTLAINGPQFLVTSQDCQLGRWFEEEHRNIWEHADTRAVCSRDVAAWIKAGPGGP